MANPTSNFGWQMPTNTDLVKDLPADFEVFGQAVDTSLMDLKGGTTGQVLSKASNTDMDFTWVAQDDSDAIQNALLTTTGDTIYASGASTPARLGIGTTGQVLTVSAGGVPSWATPASGVTTWTRRTGTTGNSTNCIAYNGSDLYIAAGQNGELRTSPDGITWTSRTSGFGANTILSVYYGNSLWVAVGENGTITTSSDGITWTARTSGVSTNTLRQVKYANSIWVAVGDGANGGTGGVTTSTDGITWTKRTTPTTTGTRMNAIEYGNGYWVAVGSYSTSNMIYSSDGTTWTVGTQIGNNQAIGIIYQNSYFWVWYSAVTNNDFVRTASPTATRTNTGGMYVPASGSYNNVSGYNNELTALQANVYTSNIIGNYFMQKIDTDLTSSTYPTFGASTALPGNNTFPMLSLYRNATGIIIAGGGGQIYTDF